jgi:acylphosphatase
MNTRAHVVVSGLVQGVCYRDFTRRWAETIGLAGWVRNLPDGRVEAIIEGEQDAIERLLGILRRGPPESRVDDLEITWLSYQGEFPGFDIAL